MKRILLILSSSLVLCLIPMITLPGQETKTEKKIKIIVDDGSGKKVIVDTVLNEDSHIETIKLKDGKMIFISDPDAKHDHSGSKHVTVIVTSDDENLEKVKDTNGHNNVAVWTSNDDEDDNSSEKTRYYVAKDGMVITVEGEDEARAKELIKLIEDNMGVKSKDEGKEVKSETKKNKK